MIDEKMKQYQRLFTNSTIFLAPPFHWGEMNMG